MHRWLCRGMSTLLLALALVGCAGMAEYPLGISSSASPKFYASMEAVAAKHGMMVSKHATSLNLQTKEGDWLQYMQRDGSIILVVIAETSGLDDSQIAARKAKLKALSDELIDEAAELSDRASAFDG